MHGKYCYGCADDLPTILGLFKSDPKSRGVNNCFQRAGLEGGNTIVHQTTDNIEFIGHCHMLSNHFENMPIHVCLQRGHKPRLCKNQDSETGARCYSLEAEQLLSKLQQTDFCISRDTFEADAQHLGGALRDF